MLAPGSRHVHEINATWYVVNVSFAFSKRIIGGAVFITCLILGGYFLWGFLLGVSLIGLFEFNRALELNWGVFAWAGYIVTIAYYVILIVFKNNTYWTLLLFGVLLIIDLAVFVFTYPRYELTQVFAGFFEVFYIGVALSFMYLLW